MRVKGHVYAKAAGPGESEASIDQPNETSTQGPKPIQGASVRVLAESDLAKDRAGKEYTWKYNAETDRDGAFDLGGTTSPFRYRAVLVVEKEGYKTLTKVFVHEKPETQQAVVVLVPSEPSDQTPKNQ